MPKSLVEMCAEIVAAQASHTRLSPEEIAESLRKVFQTLQNVQQLGNGSEFEETVTRDPQSSIQRNQVICLECGKPFKLLSNRHLALHQLTPRAYKKKHGIRMTQCYSSGAPRVSHPTRFVLDRCDVHRGACRSTSGHSAGTPIGQ